MTRSSRRPSGRVTPKKGGPAAAAARASKPSRPEKWELEGSRQVRTPWGWRALLMLSLIAAGVAIIMFGNHQSTLGVIWLVIGAGWFGFAMMLWRKHSRFMRR